jgi:hypothetical protein
MGAFAKEYIPCKKKNWIFVWRSNFTKRSEQAEQLHQCIAIVELWNGKAIDASINSNELRYVNHCCDPIPSCGVFNYHVEFYALKNINTNEN